MNIKRQIAVIKQMLYLLATIRNGKINVTAEENGIKNSNLSQLLKEFEEQTGMALLDRKSDGVEATKAGEEFCVLAQEFENTLRKFEKICRKSVKFPELKFYLPDNLSVDLNGFNKELFINYIKLDKNYDIALLNREPEAAPGLYVTKVINNTNRLTTTLWVASKDDNEEAAQLHKFLVESII